VFEINYKTGKLDLLYNGSSECGINAELNVRNQLQYGQTRFTV